MSPRARLHREATDATVAGGAPTAMHPRGACPAACQGDRLPDALAGIYTPDDFGSARALALAMLLALVYFAGAVAAVALGVVR